MDRTVDQGCYGSKTSVELVDNLELILSTIRHQLGNSVNSIKVTLEVLNQNFEIFNDGKKKDYLERGTQLLARQQMLLEALKSYSLFDARDQTEISITLLWRHFLEQASKRIGATGIALEEEADIEPLYIRGNMMALEKTVDNILDNAIDAVEGLENPRIKLRAETNNKYFHLTVQDNGPGIPENDLPRIHIPLFSTKPGKSGMGLSIAHKLVARMDGQLLFESNQAKGTRVRVSLSTT